MAGRASAAQGPLHPTHALWINLIEVWFGLVERQAVRRGVFKSVKDLNPKLRTYIEGWNKRTHPFTWTKTADQVLAKANRPATSSSRHKIQVSRSAASATISIHSLSWAYPWKGRFCRPVSFRHQMRSSHRARCRWRTSSRGKVQLDPLKLVAEQVIRQPLWSASRS